MIVYTAGKYSGKNDTETSENIQKARSVAIELWERGYAVFCPHLNTAHFEIDCKATYEDYMDGDLQILCHCDAIVMLRGWEKSQGAIREYQEALHQGIQVYIYPDMPRNIKDVKLHEKEIE